MVTKPIKDPHHYHWRHHPAITSEKNVHRLSCSPGRGAAWGHDDPRPLHNGSLEIGKGYVGDMFLHGWIYHIYICIYIYIIFYMYIHVCSMCISMHNIYIYIYLDVCNIYVYMYIHIYTLIRQLALYIMYSMNQSCIYLYTFSVRTCNICVHIYIYQQYIHTWYVPIHPKIWDWYEQQPQVQTP
jgi:hypothetical protein